MSTGNIHRRRALKLPAAAAVLSFGFDSAAHAAVFAQYLPGTYTQGTVYLDDSGDVNTYDMTFNDPTVVGDPTAGPTAGLTGVSFGFPGVVSPFDPPSDPTQLVTVGLGGEITLHFPQPVNVPPSGRAMGIFNSVGLIDTGTEIATDPASVFSDQAAVVSVSQDGKTWANLGLKTLDIPQNYYVNATDAYQYPAPDPGIVADFGKPFTGTLDSFDGETFAQTLATLNGSAGGTWLDLSGTGLTQINYIQFSEPSGVVPMTSYVALEAVSGSQVSVPEPASIAGLLVGTGLLLRRARKAVVGLLLAAGLFAMPSPARAMPVSALAFQDGNVLNVLGSFGAGADTAYLVVDFNAVSQSDAWQVNWNPGSAVNGWQMLEDIAGNSNLTTSGVAGTTTVSNPAGDPDLTVTAEFFPSFSEHFVQNFQEAATTGVNNDWNFFTGTYNSANVSLGNPQGMTWASSKVGIDQVSLANGEFIGFVDVASKPPNPVLPETALPEPTAVLGLLGFVGMLLRRMNFKPPQARLTN